MRGSRTIILGLMALLLFALPLLAACDEDELDDGLIPEKTDEATPGDPDRPVKTLPPPTDEASRPIKTALPTDESNPSKATLTPTVKPPKTTDVVPVATLKTPTVDATPVGPQPMLDCSALKTGADWAWSEAAEECIRKEDGTWLWQGFHHEWDDTSHRFRDLHSEFYNIEYDFDLETGHSTLSGELRGSQPVGTCEDELLFRSRKICIKTGVAEFRHGSIDDVIIGGDVDDYVENVFPKQIPLDGLEDYDNVTIVMRGFGFDEIGGDTDGGTGAYPIRGFGLKVSNMERMGNMLQLDLTVMLHPAPKPINTSPTPDPWSYSVRYDYTLIGGNEDEFSVTTGHEDYYGPRVSLDSGECPNASAQDRQLTIEGEGKQAYDAGVVAFRGFFIKINNDGNTSGISGEPATYLGRLVRSVEASIAGQSYNWSTGEAIVTQNLYFCNHSASQLAMNTYYHGFYTLLQFNDPDQWAEIAVGNDAGGGDDIDTADQNDTDSNDDGYSYDVSLESAAFNSP